ncbi:hypothetical protein [Bacillus sp. CECT 9360]|uniref:hypothetical protein n=1 Tax=Bacillus sp. CECT 9360 TaxID=2845821 RepID=UPI001E58D757|nr:hypothetical protein [Bacillus sp. CECT 9360]CAH0345295.1 hypothetical protein BCI9360_01577 [Bacillus sp. CECT 9360]
MKKKLLDSKLIIAIISVHFLLLFALSPFSFAKAKTDDSGGFVIQADRVVGTNMKPSVVFTETSSRDKVPMMRIHYEEAVIYGMKLTKQLNTPQGPVSITLKADGPVRMRGMTVDTSAISLKGACLRTTETIPQAGLEDVTMLVHYMNAEGSNIEELILQTVPGNEGPAKPKKTQILVDLALLPYNQAVKEVQKMSEGKEPLVCDEPEDEGKSDTSNEAAANPVTDAQLEKIVPDEAGDVIDETVEDVKEPVEEVTDQITKPVQDTVKKTVKPINEKVIKPVEKKLEPITKPVQENLSASCKRLRDSGGKISKELGIDLIDEALKKDKALTELCDGNASLSKQLEKLEEGLTSKLGLDFLFKTLSNEEQRLKKMKERLEGKDDNYIILL